MPWNERRKIRLRARHGRQKSAPATVQPTALAATPSATGSPTAESAVRAVEPATEIAIARATRTAEAAPATDQPAELAATPSVTGSPTAESSVRAVEPATEIAIARATRTQEIPAATATLATDQPTELATTPIVIDSPTAESAVRAVERATETYDCARNTDRQKSRWQLSSPPSLRQHRARRFADGRVRCPRSGTSDGNCDCARNANGRSRAGNGPARRACSHTERDRYADGRVLCPRRGTSDGNCDCARNTDARNSGGYCHAGN